MYKPTVLDLVNSILVGMRLERVDSLDETPEATDAASVLKETYYNILSNKEWNFNKKTFALTSLVDTSKPVVMKIPEGVTDIEYIKYLDGETGEYKNVKYLKPQEFLETLTKRTGEYGVYTNLVSKLNTEMKILEDRNPEFWTSFDEENIVFDAFDKTQFTTLLEKDVLCYGTVVPNFELTEDYEVDLPEDFIWSYYLPEAKANAQFSIVQEANQMEMEKAKKGRLLQARKHPKSKNEYEWLYPRWGRR